MTMTRAVSSPQLEQSGVVNGAAASTDMTVTGIETEDTIIFAQGFADTTAAPTDRTSTITITDSNDIQSSANLSAESLLVLWHDASGRGIGTLNLRGIATAGAAASTDMTITGITTEDTIIAAWECDDTSGLFTDRTSTITITDDDDIQSSADCSGGTVWVFWHEGSGDREGKTGFAATSIKFAQTAGSATTSTVTGIATEDTLISVVELLTADYTMTDRLATTTITAANTITSGVSTLNDILLVVYHDASA